MVFILILDRSWILKIDSVSVIRQKIADIGQKKQ